MTYRYILPYLPTHIYPNINKLINSIELEKIKDRVLFYVDEFYRKYPDLIFDYNSIDKL